MTTELTASQGSVQSSRKTLVNDLKRVVGDADGLLKEVVSSSADQLAAARSRIEATLGDARVAVKNRACSATKATNQYVRDNPMKTIGFAALAGLVAAFLLSRRSS